MSSSIRNSCTRAALLAAVVLSTPGAAFAQGALEDYQRADSLGSRFRGLLHNTRIEARWFEDGSGLWYRRQLPEGRSEFVIVRAEKGERALAFDHGKLAAALSKAHGSKIESDRLPIERIAPAGDGALLIRASGKSWKCSLDSYELTKHDGEIPEGKRGKKLDRSRRQRWSGRRRGHRSDRSPDKKWQTFERDRNLWIRGIEDNKAPEKLVAEAGEEHKYEGSVFWSPDSKHFVALRRKEAEPHIVYMIDPLLEQIKGSPSYRKIALMFWSLKDEQDHAEEDEGDPGCDTPHTCHTVCGTVAAPHTAPAEKRRAA